MTIRAYRSRGSQYNLEQRQLARQDALYGEVDGEKHSSCYTLDLAAASSGASPATANKMYLSRLKGNDCNIDLTSLSCGMGGPAAGTANVGVAVYEMNLNERGRTILTLIPKASAWIGRSNPGTFSSIVLSETVPLSRKKAYIIGCVTDTAALSNSIYATLPLFLIGKTTKDDVTATTGFPQTIDVGAQTNSTTNVFFTAAFARITGGTPVTIY